MRKYDTEYDVPNYLIGTPLESPGCRTPYSNGRAHADALRELLGLEMLRNLEHLSLIGVVIDEPLIESFTIRAEEKSGCSILFPSMTELTLYSICDPRVSERAMEEMVVSRWKKSRLQSVTVYTPGLRKGMMKNEQLKKCMEEGLEFSVGFD